jgi:hypothetical protein
VKSSNEVLQGSDARQNREIQHLMNGMKRLETLIAEQQKQITDLRFKVQGDAQRPPTIPESSPRLRARHPQK